MRAILYYPWIYLRGGAERMLLELVRRSRHEWTVCTNHFAPGTTFPEFGAVPVRQLERVGVDRDAGTVLKAAITIRRQRIATNGHAAAIIVSEGFGNLQAGRLGVPTSCLCMTPLKVAYDPLTRRRFLRDAHSGYALAFAMYRSVDRRTWRHYQRVFCVSEEVRRRLIDASLVEAARLEILRPGVDTEAFSPAGEREPFFLVAGRIMWQKNIELALDAWRHFNRSAQGRIFRLVVAGMVDGKSESYLRHLRGLASDLSDVEFVVRPSDEELISLYRRCHAVLFTAPNEDFGLVPLEAMACGKPVVAIGRGGPRETIVPDETGILARGDIASFAEAIGVIAEIPPAKYARMSQATRQRAMEFSWDSFAHRLDEHVETLGVGPTRPTLVRR